jgi:hypothetical protein
MNSKKRNQRIKNLTHHAVIEENVYKAPLETLKNKDFIFDKYELRQPQNEGILLIEYSKTHSPTSAKHE